MVSTVMTYYYSHIMVMIVVCSPMNLAVANVLMWIILRQAETKHSLQINPVRCTDKDEVQLIDRNLT